MTRLEWLMIAGAFVIGIGLSLMLRWGTPQPHVPHIGQAPVVWAMLDRG